MRIVLRRDDEQLTIVRAFEARDAKDVREFSSEHIALAYLDPFLGDGMSLLSLRSELESTRETLDVMRLSDLEVLRTFARLLASGLLKVVRSVVPRATLSLGETPAQGKAEPGKAPPFKDKPAPIVPQEYPILARVESNGMIDATRKLVADLQKLVHMIFSRNPPPSQVAAEYVSTMKETAAETRREIEKLDIDIEKLLFRGPMPPPPPSDIAIAYQTLGNTEGKLSKQIVQSFAVGLKSLLWEPTERVPSPSEIAREYETLGALESDRAKASIGALAVDLETLLHKDSDRSEPSPTIALEYASLVKREGANAHSVVQSFALGLGKLLHVPTEVIEPAAAIATEYMSLGKQEGEQAQTAIQSFSAGLDGLLFKPSELDTIRVRSDPASDAASEPSEKP